jgi:LCP family protein required for cell wall assembly
MSQALPNPPRRSRSARNPSERRRLQRTRLEAPQRQTATSQSAPVADLHERRQQRMRPQTRRRPPLLAFALGIALGYGLAGPLPKLLPSPQSLASIVNPVARGDRRIVVLGVDHVGDNTDVMLSVQLHDGKTEVLQVPRDTFVESQKFGVVKANALYAFGGMDAVKQELSTLLHAKVDRYLRVNLQAVERLAEAIGGVEVDVPKRMYYVDNAQGLYIDLYPGVQLLKGEELEGFLRYRNDELGDLGRMERQKQVLAAVFTKLADPTTLTRLPELLKVAGSDIQTDLNPIELGQLITAMANTKLSTSQLPGRLFWHNDLSYWMPESNQHYAGLDSTEPAL